jgi:hypothetical protein
MNRRQSLELMMAGMILPAAAAAAATRAASGPGERLDLARPADLLAAMIKLRAATDGSLAIEWLKGVQYGLVDAVLTPFFTLNSVTLSWYRPAADGSFQGRRLEVVYHGELATNRPLREFRNPYTGQVVPVEATRSIPLPVLFTTAGLVLPPKLGDSRIEADSSIGPAIFGGKHVWIRFDTRSRVYPPGAERPGFTYNETTTYQGHRDQVEDAATSNARCQVSYNSVLGFKPWMAMGDIRGALSNNATGEKVRSVAELPADIREFLAATHPDILKDPRAAVDASPGAA